MKYRHNLTVLPTIIVLIGSLAGSPCVRAEDDAAAHKAAAEELLQAMQSQRTVERLADQMGMIADRLNPPGRPLTPNPADDAALRDSLRQQARDILKEQLKWETLEPQFAQLYEDAFTEPELKQLAEFYKSPVGQKLIDKQPELATKLGRLTQQRAMAAIPAVTQKLRASVQKFREEHPAKVTSPAPAAAAGASPMQSSGSTAVSTPSAVPTASALSTVSLTPVMPAPSASPLPPTIKAAPSPAPTP